MTPTLDAFKVVESSKGIIGSVPPAALGYVCSCCMGPVGSGFATCYGCKRIFDAAPALRGRVVPMSIALNPGLWYNRFIGYKNGDAEAHTTLGCLATAYLVTHAKKIKALLGGPPTAMMVVPSTRLGRTFDKHPLAYLIRRSKNYKDMLVDGIVFVPGSVIGRQEYKPGIFNVDRTNVRGARVVVMEDLWVSGSKAVSAAGAILGAGAASVAILPIGREVKPSTGPQYCPEDYVTATKAPYDIRAWPR